MKKLVILALVAALCGLMVVNAVAQAATYRSDFIKSQAKWFSEQYPDRHGIAMPFAWGTGKFLKESGTPLPIEWYAYSNTDGNMIFIFDFVMPKDELEKMQVRRGWDVCVPEGDKKTTLIALGNGWALGEDKIIDKGGVIRQGVAELNLIRYFKDLRIREYLD
ncbi:MAG: hypothetical protein UX02_C0001G0034 [Candidatus Moranbacteria bacterium GW2011_GWC1_45_18]|nr:MAG: hypothetical protein UT79_C0002G0363 [Candidatus Moranbacteria bacterium GW2011_GWC2_40_12]KKT34204.1 MAG: hypothetical protein UW19_C0001G0099 [Candidatus Moranbacteria bacterium GW2011_GWF2_44_10]KKT72394.1 MAG: hypothetical protein UW66_C0004G0007 [Candidatus Moranbacteria bacterium GW2011_GWF1_44_4]KKU00586.1 MAG: hypothetical protein UX02_C0001G0034 [Candidatus Moranbacteria bacterium GW2011_GWC1_45_18]OGI24431.1 MAG: hypothetical protein A2194_01470 [Candidatus Moranbacteria bacte